MKMKLAECSETSAYKIQTAGNYPDESIQLYRKLCVTPSCVKYYLRNQILDGSSNTLYLFPEIVILIIVP